MPHAPQLWLSALVIVQRPEQFVWPATQETAQWPVPSQTSPEGQTVPHAPQLWLSVLVIVQSPEQFVSPATHRTTQ